MDEGAIRKTLEELTGELDQLEARRQAILTAQKGLEALLGLRSKPEMQTELQLPTPNPTKQKGTRSLRSAVKQVIQDARGSPLHSKEILKRARAMGASTAAKDPVAIIDLVMSSLRRDGGPVERTAPRTWRWTE